MMTDPTGTTIRHHRSSDVDQLLDTLTQVWADAHTEADDVAAAGFTPDTLRRQILGHTRRQDFTLITARNGDECIGFGYGFRCSPEYWFGPDLLPSITEAARTTESLVGICEMAVRRYWHGRGIGTLIHEEILNVLQPEWVSLLAMPDSSAQRLYRRLGYHYAGQYSPTSDGPALDLLLRPPTATPDNPPSGQGAQ